MEVNRKNNVPVHNAAILPMLLHTKKKDSIMKEIMKYESIQFGSDKTVGIVQSEWTKTGLREK